MIALEAAAGALAALGLAGLAFLRGRFRRLADPAGARVPAQGDDISAWSGVWRGMA
jgi:hypothetical protein